MNSNEGEKMNSDDMPVKIIVEKTIKYENGCIKCTPVINVEEYDDIMGPILREFANFEQLSLHPGFDCEIGNPRKCVRYDMILKIYNKYKTMATRAEMKTDHNAPDLMFFLGMPPFCQVCWEREHQRRKKANSLRARLKRALKKIARLFTWAEPSR